MIKRLVNKPKENPESHYLELKKEIDYNQIDSNNLITQIQKPVPVLNVIGQR